MFSIFFTCSFIGMWFDSFPWFCLNVLLVSGTDKKPSTSTSVFCLVMVNRSTLFSHIYRISLRNNNNNKKGQFAIEGYSHLLKRKLTQTPGFKFSSSTGFPSLDKDLWMPAPLFASTLSIRKPRH